MRHCAGFEFPFDSELRAEETWAGSWERVGKGLGSAWDGIGKGLGLVAGNYQHDSRVMTLIVGAACDTREMGKS